MKKEMNKNISWMHKEEAEKVLPIFPNLRLFGHTKDKQLLTPLSKSSITIETYVETNGYYVLLKKSFVSPDYINYVDLQRFVDTLQVEVNKMKLNFKMPPNIEGLDKTSVYKIIE